MIVLIAPVNAGKLSYRLGLDADLIKQEVSAEDSDAEFDVTNQVLVPYLYMDYLGPKLYVQGRATNNHVRRDLDENSVSQNYAEYNYTAQYSAIDNFLSFSAAGSQRYLSERIESFDVDDFLLNSALRWACLIDKLFSVA